MTHNGFACFSLGLSDELDNVHTYKAKRAIYKFVEGSLLWHIFTVAKETQPIRW